MRVQLEEVKSGRVRLYDGRRLIAVIEQDEPCPICEATSWRHEWGEWLCGHAPRSLRRFVQPCKVSPN